MKKLILGKIILCMVLVLLMGVILSSCKTETHPEVDGLTLEQVLKIRQTYFEYRHSEGSDSDKNKIFIVKYLGTYNGNIAVKINDGNNTQSITADGNESIDGIVIDGIYIGNPSRYELYYLYIEATDLVPASVIYLEDAYYSGYIDKENLQEIAAYERED